MTMFVDRRKPNYDELLLLANDARASRTRRYRWTTGLVVTAFLGTAVYIGSINQQVDSLRETAKEAERQLDGVVNERNQLRAELSALSRYQDFYAEVAPTFDLGDNIEQLARKFNPGPGTVVTETKTEFGLANLVWIVNGSRRFPMTNGDILWVPEGKFWVELEDFEHRDDALPNDVDEDEKAWARILVSRSRDPDAPKEKHKIGLADHFYQEEAPWAEDTFGNANCVRLTLHPRSLRQGFSEEKYRDMEVLIWNNPNCERGVISADDATPAGN